MFKARSSITRYIQEILIDSKSVTVCNKRQISTSSICYSYEGYKGTWANHRRVQNPEITKEIPVVDQVKNGKFKKSNLVYVCGLGATGSLGLPQYYKPQKKDLNELNKKDVRAKTFKRLGAFSTSDSIRDVACGYGFTIVAANVDGSSHTAFGFGLNSHSQLGYQVTRAGFPLEIVSTPSPIFLPTDKPVAKASCGRSHSLLLNQDGQVFAIGNNSLGQCGRPVKEHEIYFGSKTVTQLDNFIPSNVVDIVCGQDHSMFLTADGLLYSCGWGADGQTGLGHYNVQWEPAQVKGDVEGVKLVKVSSYADTVLALDSDGNVFGWGNTEYAQFRILTNIESEQFNSPRHLKLKGIPGKIVDIAAGGTICAVLNHKGQVFVWGFGILGKGPDVDQSSRPTLIPESLFGKNVYNPDIKVDKVYASLSHFAAINSIGELYAWGKNRSGSLGFAHGKDQYFPMRVNTNMAMVKKVALGVDHTCALVQKVC